MRIFLSYASEDRVVAALVAESLKARGHRVFFDKSDLPPGETYEDQIEAAIGKAGMLVFLISPKSVQYGRFTRTELSFAEQKWASAKGRVLPVEIEATPIDDVPAYLRPVSILQPEGNIPAETAAHVHRLARRWPRLLGRAAILASMIAAVGLIYWQLRDPVPEIKLTVSQHPFERGIFERPPIDNFVYKIENVGTVAAKLLWVDLETRPEASVTITHQSEQIDLLTGVPMGPGADHRGFVQGHPSATAEDVLEYRVCAEFDQAPQICSPWATWAQFKPNQYLYGDAFEMPVELRNAEGPIASHGGDVLFGVGNQIIALNGEGETRALTFPDRITAMYAGPLGRYAAVAGATPSIYRFDLGAGLVEEGFATLPAPGLRNVYDEPVSSVISSFADDGSSIWFKTDERLGEPTLGFFEPGSGQSELAPYWQDLAFDLGGLELKSGTGRIWSGSRNSTPTTVYALERAEYSEFSGHDYEALSCVSDVYEIAENTVLFPNCEGVIQSFVLGAQGPAISNLDSSYRTLGYGSEQADWSDVLINQTPSGYRFAIVANHSNERFGGDGSFETTLNRIGYDKGSKMAFNLEGAQFYEYAMFETGVLLRLRSEDGTIQNVPISLVPN